MTSNKWYTKKTPFSGRVFNTLWHHMVWSVLLRVVAQKTTFWLVEIFWQPIRSFYSMVFEATTRNKTEHTMWKGIENCARKWCLFLCTILFEVTWVFWKMCRRGGSRTPLKTTGANIKMCVCKASNFSTTVPDCEKPTEKRNCLIGQVILPNFLNTPPQNL